MYWYSCVAFLWEGEVTWQANYHALSVPCWVLYITNPHSHLAGQYYSAHFIQEETEFHQGLRFCPRTHSTLSSSAHL